MADKREQHGHWSRSDMSAPRRSSREYSCWSNMKTRCLNPRNPAFPEYGGRGITVCDRWATSFTSFLEDMGRSPSPSHSIDRINTDGNYAPGNVRWATKSEQAFNRRPRRHVKITREQASEIRVLVRQGVPHQWLADQYGLCKPYISQIVRYISWKEVD